MVLDTNILVAYLKGEPEVVAAVEQWRQEGRGLVVSCISFAEVLALPALTGSEIQVVTRFLRSFLCIPREAIELHLARPGGRSSVCSLIGALRGSAVRRCSSRRFPVPTGRGDLAEQAHGYQVPSNGDARGLREVA
jgi:hypothetical protein